MPCVTTAHKCAGVPFQHSSQDDFCSACHVNVSGSIAPCTSLCNVSCHIFAHKSSSKVSRPVIQGRLHHVLAGHRVLTLNMDVPEPWLVEPVKADYDLDNLRLEVHPALAALRTPRPFPAAPVPAPSADAPAMDKPEPRQTLLGRRTRKACCRPRTFGYAWDVNTADGLAVLDGQDLGNAGSLEVAYELEALMLTGQCIDIAARTRQAVRLPPQCSLSSL